MDAIFEDFFKEAVKVHTVKNWYFWCCSALFVIIWLFFWSLTYKP